MSTEKPGADDPLREALRERADAELRRFSLPTREELACSVCRADMAPFLIDGVRFCLKCWKARQ
jgi:hypothetical protein